MRWQRELNNRLRPLGLTQPQFAILAIIGWLTRNDHKVSQQDIADYLGLDRMHISQISRRLEQNGWIERQIATTDLRSRQITLTLEGKALLAQAVPLVEEFDMTFFASITPNPSLSVQSDRSILKQSNAEIG